MTTVGFNQVASFSPARTAAGSIALVLLAAAMSVAPAPALAQGTPEQREACQPDAMRLCSEFVPDVDRITACMKKNRLRLSPPCRVFFAPPRKGKIKRAD
jgi:hypothetical protein